MIKNWYLFSLIDEIFELFSNAWVFTEMNMIKPIFVFFFQKNDIWKQDFRQDAAYWNTM